MKTELDSLATALYVTTDNLLKDSPQLAPWRPAVGIAPQLSDAELVTLAIMSPRAARRGAARRGDAGAAGHLRLPAVERPASAELARR